MKASAFKAQLWVLILTTFRFFCSRTHLKLVCTKVGRCFLSQRRNPWVKVRYNRPLTWNHGFWKINEWVKEATLACQFFAMWVGSLFSKKEPAGYGWVYIPLTDSYNILFKILEQELLLILNHIRKPKPEVRSFWSFFQKNGTRDSLIFRIRKTDLEVINKIKEPHNTRPPLLVFTAVQISSGYGSKRSLSQTSFLRGGGV